MTKSSGNYIFRQAPISRDGFGTIYHIRGTYDYAELGGAIKAYSLGVWVPKGAVVLGGMVDSITTCVSAGADAGTMALSILAANDLVTAIAISDGTNPWDAGLHAIKPLWTAATGIKMTAKGVLTATIASQIFSAGKFHVHLFYVMGD
jgi:hypothetical protein